jgi:DNA-binding PadR family transcriptional regulator
MTLRMKTQRALTRRQQDALYIVSKYGPVSANDLSYHLLGSYSAAYGLLTALERRGLIDATYTNLGLHSPTNDRKGFVITNRGEEVLADYEAELEDE